MNENEYIVGFDVDLYKPVEVSVFAPDEYTAVMNATFMFQVKHEQDLCYLNKIEFVKEVPAEDEDKAELEEVPAEDEDEAEPEQVPAEDEDKAEPEQVLSNKKCFFNAHCCTSDCPNIQFDIADQRYGYGIAEDMGLKRISCKECYYYTCKCENCLFFNVCTTLKS